MQDKRNTESVVQEIMGLVREYGLEMSWDMDWKDTLIKIESKLRDLAENKFFVQEPLSDYEIAKLDCVYLEEVQYSGDVEISQTSVIEFARAIERAHNITQEPKQ